MTDIQNNNRSRKHSFVRFYPSDWLAGTARLPRLHRSVFFDICCFIWDTAKPVPKLELRMMLNDLPDADQIVEDLVSLGKVERLDDGSIVAERAMIEAKKSLEAWEAMSKAGRDRHKGAGKVAAKGANSGAGNGAARVADASLPAGNKKNQEPRTKSSTDVEPIVVCWNAMADANGLPRIVKMSSSRTSKLAARIEDFGEDRICAAIETIPDSDFLMGDNDRGWKANIDWLVKPDKMAKLIEGGYHGNGRGSGWLNATD